MQRLIGLCTAKTYSVVLTGVVAMIMYPDAQARAQSEIDTAIGEHRLPTMKDKGSLPYVEAFIKEIMRWSPTLPLSKSRKIQIFYFFRLPMLTLIRYRSADRTR